MLKQTLLCLFLSSLFITNGCADLKDAGRTIGHTTRDVTTAIGHASRDAAKSVKAELDKGEWANEP
ncbi:hypothetical protein PVK64_02875 [Aliivibrio sp. S4TY2]|uniref:hypothetical protein n=1 Tax=unclassified Aliivibrio TaxID=2645654 RepID=UPI0023780E7E|nr:MULTISPECIES: hypothetical protein [unclassified Aliivibrio]MDD9155136.1 hypothetical protein [Aliivibrio sp. S4TY2]MDD9159312.1 hypothetical protein [Aliivibrio sp. S4TY1]MDD9163138.1 hypothetical protein [Aliivibrio sp. S4MY2]MDD9167311.1 hypothetical protein [Aliivibrio sp. S4MY4]MDD9184215.1 hypothetical protein [Aliivibrio sp. S4MY3]